MIDRVFAGRYRITEKIGIGGMAEVYKATDETLGRTVAVKVMLPQYASDESFAIRFKQEAQAAANLQSPYIVNIYDWGFEETNKTYYIVMEYIRGTDLKTAITQRGAINQRKVAEIGAQVAAALGVAHSYDIIHRDIKPQNIMVQPDGNAKVMDFGIARSNNANLTQTGSVLGTAYYVSPEQAQGKSLSAATDIYSLGVVLYEAVTGRVPFDGPDAVSIAVKQVNEQPVPPRAIDSTIDASLEAIILKAMAKNPAERFATADKMRLALTEYLQGKPLSDVDSDARTRVITTPAVVPPAQATAVMPELATEATRTRSNTSGAGNGSSSSNSKKGLIIALVSVLAVLLIGIAVYFAFCSNTAEGDISVPDLRGMTEEEATHALEEVKLQLGKVTKESSETTEEGKVISQDPAMMSKVTEGTKVNIVISSGTGSIEVPDLRGMTPEAAKAELEKLGLKYKEGTPAADPDIPSGAIASQSPAAGSKLKEGETVTVVISTGTETADIPNVANMTQDQATKTLQDAGFQVSVVQASSSSVAAGYVISQDKVGKVKKGETVTITVSTGSSTADVPNVVGWGKDDAGNAITNAGFTVKYVEESSSSAAAGTVIRQDHVGQTEKGATVTLTISTGPEPEPTP